MEEIKVNIEKCLKLIDRFSNLMGFPVIRKFLSYSPMFAVDTTETVIRYLYKVGYERIKNTSEEDAILVSPFLHRPNFNNLFISSQHSAHCRDVFYSNAVKAVRYIPIDELLNMSDDELLLLIKLN